MKVAVVTPYYKESRDILLRCVRSVRKQTYPVQHIMVSDGYPQDVRKVTHIRIPPSADTGNTPRGVGVLVALAQGADAIALLDADCWMEPRHIQNMVEVMKDQNVPVVTCPRRLWNPDTGKAFAVDEESEGNVWNDTNCFLIRSDVAHLFQGWMFGKKNESLIQDRIFWQRIKESGVRIARMDTPSVNYDTTIAAHYLAHKEPMCANAKVIMNEGNGWVIKPYADMPQLSVELHSLFWPNINQKLVSAHTHVMRHFGLEVAYTGQEIPHGEWMNNILANSTADIVGFMDIDCVPTNPQIVQQLIQWVSQTKAFIAPAQVSNHIPPFSHIFAAPSFFFIWRKTWEEMGRPTFSETPQADVAENVSYAAEVNRIPYKTLYPLAYTKAPDEGIWKLHTYGQYGIGTVYEGGVFHLFQGRMPGNADLFADVCDRICRNEFTTEGMIPCR